MLQNLSHLGASGLIGFSSFKAEILKLMIKSVKKRVRIVSFS